MRPAKTPGETRVFRAPQNWNDERMGCECGALSIRDERYHGAATMVSTWELDQADLDTLLAGGKLQLRIFGNVNPVVSLWVNVHPVVSLWVADKRTFEK